jgi:hypothetical protein
MYPDYRWLPWKFGKCPRNFWDDMKNQKEFMDWAGKHFKVKEISDWYNVSFNVNITVTFVLKFFLGAA